MPHTTGEKWKSLRVKRSTHHRFKVLAAIRGTTIDQAIRDALVLADQKARSNRPS